MLLPGSRAARAGAAALAAAALACAVAPASSHAAAGFAGGNIAYQSGTQCGFDGSIGYGTNTGSWVSWYTDPQAGYPAVGDRYWVRLDAMAIGYTCAGFVSDITTELALPANTSLAVNLQSQDPNDRIRCFYEGPSGTFEVTDKTWRIPDLQASGSWCDSKRVPSPSAHGYHLGQRMIGPGESFFIVAPVVSTKRLAGMGGAGDTTKAIATLTSGINTTAKPYQWVTVFDRLTQVTYPDGAATELTNTTAKTTSILNAYWRKGSAYVDLGFANGDFSVSTNPIQIDGQWPQYTVAQTWTGLTPGTDYKFRLRFVDEQGVQTVGDAKTFRTTGTKPVTPPATGPGTPGGGGGTGGGGTGGGGGVTPTPDPGTPSKPVDGEKPGGGGGGDGQTPTPGGGTVTPAPGSGGGTGGGVGARSSAAPATDGATHKPSSLPPAARLATGAKLGALLTPAGLTVNVTCATACLPKVTLKVDAATARKLGLGRKATVVATGAAKASATGTIRVVLEPTAAAKRKLRRAKQLNATLTVQAGSGAPVATTVTLRR